MKPKKLAIIGGGASGMIASLIASQSGGRAIVIQLFEQNERIGKKLLATGNGRCNITNIHADRADYFGGNPHFGSPALESFRFPEFECFCRSLGLFLETKEDGRVYPASNEAKSVLLSFEEAIVHSDNITLHTESKITGIVRKNGGFELELASKKEGKISEKFGAFDAVILATGSNAAPQLGGGDAGYALARALGHEIAPLYPSLVQLHLARLPVGLAGVKITGIASILVNEKCVKTEQGDLLFTPYGISGFAILDISQSASYALLQGKKVELLLDIAPSFSKEELMQYFEESCAKMGKKRTIYALLAGIISPKIAHTILKELKIAPLILLENLPKNAPKSIAKLMKSWRFSVVQTHGFKHAEVSGGGVLCEEIDPHSMASVRHQGLYFAGEMIDIVGQRGGYNLAFAWASGRLAALSAVEFLKHH
ncbi:MAG: NAD(P)/FAD-dependent oxidoreductase [Wolinella sp.]